MTCFDINLMQNKMLNLKNSQLAQENLSVFIQYNNRTYP